MTADRQTLRRKRALIGALALALALMLTLNSMIWPGLLVAFGTLLFLGRRHGVPVIVYHSVSPDARWLPWAQNISVRPQVFQAHMLALKRAGWRVVPDRQLFDATSAKQLRRAVAVHFDDAYFDIATYALPVLRAHEFPATVFASTDFIDPSVGVRDTAKTADLRGYLNADELRAIDADQLFEVACHGTDHARLAISAEKTPRDVEQWGPETAYLWSLLPREKSRWFDTPPPNVTEVPTSDSALTAYALTPNGSETEAERGSRVRAMLSSGRRVLSSILKRDVDYLCWPFDRVTDAALADAKAVGFQRFTGGQSDNRRDRPTDTLSRTHIHDHAAGHTHIWVETIVFRARIEVAAGNLLWWPIAAFAGVRRRRVTRILHGPTP